MGDLLKSAGPSYIGGMRQRLTTAAAVFALALPVQADETGNEDNGTALMERGAQMFFEGIMREMEPALEDLEGLAEEMGPELHRFVQEMGPAFAELLSQIEDLSAYHPPEMLPNGDIILRRKTPEEMGEAPPEDIEI